MATFSVPAPRLAGLVSAIPDHVETEADLAARFGENATRRIVQATGIHSRPVAPPGQTTADLAEAAARRLLDGVGWDPASVGLIVVVTQTGDYPLPATACLLQHRLGLPTTAAAFDVNLGCSGYVYGLSIVSGLLAAGMAKRALLVAGDTTSHLIDAGDRSVAPLFGDAVAATALERAEGGGHIAFDLGTDGAGAPYLTSRTGGARQPGPACLQMDGTQVMAFSLRMVPRSIGAVLDLAGWAVPDVDRFVLHQANAMMLQALGRKIGAPADRVVIAVGERGNTSSASIPLALTDTIGAGPLSAESRWVLCGFGVGWSWATAAWRVHIPFAETIRVSHSAETGHAP